MILGTPLDRYLDPGETLVWSGQPKQGVRLQAGDVFMIPFSLLWGGFAFFWEASVLGLIPFGHGHGGGHPPIFMAVFGLPFVVIGLYMMVGRFFGDAIGRRRTWYGVTAKRVLVFQSGLLGGTAVSSLDYANLTNLNLVERKDNSGDILFGFPLDLPGMASGDSLRSRRFPGVPGFYLLPQARTTYNLIRELQQKARTQK